MRQLVVHGEGQKPNTFFSDAGYGEFYVPCTGVTYSDPKIANFFDKKVDLPGTTDAPWLPEETEAIAAKTDTNNFVLVEGDLGAGKSTALFGLRSLLRDEETPYTLINGHYLNKGPAMARAIQRATRLGGLVIMDSFDYLFMAKGGKGKEASKIRPTVTSALGSHLEAGHKVVATAHTDPWFDKFSNPQLAADLKDFAGDAIVHRVYGGLTNPMHLRRVCEAVGGLAYAKHFIDLSATSIEPTARTYRIAKLLGSQLGASDIESLTPQTFDSIVRELDGATRAKMNAPPEYQLIPH